MTPINKDQLLKKIGDNIRDIRKEKQMEVKELAVMLGISKQALGQIEMGRTDLNISRAVDIANVLKVGFEKILDLGAGDTLNYTSSGNTGGYHVQQTGGVLTVESLAEKTIKDEELVALVKKMAAHLNIS